MNKNEATGKVAEFAKAIGWSEDDVLQLVQEANLRISDTKMESQGIVSLKAHTEQLLNNLGLPSTHEGFGYLHKAIVMVYQDPSLRYGMAIRLYPEIAKHCHVTKTQVERMLFSAVCDIWDEDNKDALKAYFGIQPRMIEGTMPSPSKFILKMVDHLGWELAD